MARGLKTGGRQKGARNRATEEARVAAQATGILPLQYMLSIMRDPAADNKRRDAMAIAAAPYLHPKLSSVEAKMSPTTDEPSPRKIEVVFVMPGRDHTGGEDQECVEARPTPETSGLSRPR